jgi:hypothetical protein
LRCGSPGNSLERAKIEGVFLVGPGGLLAGATKTVQAALDAEMADHLGMRRVSGRRSAWVITATAPRPELGGPDRI